MLAFTEFRHDTQNKMFAFSLSIMGLGQMFVTPSGYFALTLEV